VGIAKEDLEEGIDLMDTDGEDAEEEEEDSDEEREVAEGFIEDAKFAEEIGLDAEVCCGGSRHTLPILTLSFFVFSHAETQNVFASGRKQELVLSFTRGLSLISASVCRSYKHCISDNARTWKTKKTSASSTSFEVTCAVARLQGKKITGCRIGLHVKGERGWCKCLRAFQVQ
jgi:hypothetical protein